MSQYSPTVHATGGQAFADALGQLVPSYLASRQRKLQLDEGMYDRGLRPETDEERGIREGTTAAPIPTQGATNQHLAAALNPNVGLPQPKPMTAEPSYTNGQFASALGGYGDQQIGGQHYRLTDVKQAQLAAALALQRAEIVQKNASAFKDTREGGQLRLGDPGYAGALGAVEGAKTDAETPGLVRRRSLMVPIETQEAIDKARGLMPLDIAKAGGVARAELPSKIALQSNESGLVEGRETRLAPVRAKATVDAYKAKQSVAPLDRDEAAVVQHLPVVARAYQQIQQLAPGGPSAITDAIRKAGGAANYLNTPQGVMLNRAIKQLTLSGAVASEGPRGASGQQQKAFEAAYGPQGWDNPQTMKQLFSDVQGMMRAAKVRAGRGWERMDPQDRAIVEGAIGGGAGAPTGANPFESLVPKTTP